MPPRRQAHGGGSRSDLDARAERITRSLSATKPGARDRPTVGASARACSHRVRARPAEPRFVTKPTRLVDFGRFAGPRAAGFGDLHGCAIASTGLTCWGHNINGQVDPAQAAECAGGCTLAPTPVALAATRVVVGARHTCALDDHGAVWCWGDNEDGQLARTDAFLVGARGLAFSGATDLVAGARHTCVITADHTAWCWGKN
jgi:hypothetical protein